MSDVPISGANRAGPDGAPRSSVPCVRSVAPRASLQGSAASAISVARKRRFPTWRRADVAFSTSSGHAHCQNATCRAARTGSGPPWRVPRLPRRGGAAPSTSSIRPASSSRHSFSAHRFAAFASSPWRPRAAAPDPRSASGRGSTAARSPRRSPNGRPPPPPPDPGGPPPAPPPEPRPSTRGADDPDSISLAASTSTAPTAPRPAPPLPPPSCLPRPNRRQSSSPSRASLPLVSQNPRVGGPRSAQQRLRHRPSATEHPRRSVHLPKICRTPRREGVRQILGKCSPTSHAACLWRCSQ